MSTYPGHILFYSIHFFQTKRSSFSKIYIKKKGQILKKTVYVSPKGEFISKFKSWWSNLKSLLKTAGQVMRCFCSWCRHLKLWPQSLQWHNILCRWIALMCSCMDCNGCLVSKEGGHEWRKKQKKDFDFICGIYEG